MTEIEAYKLLGISRSASAAKATQAYLKKHDVLRRKLCPGNTKADRQKAQAKIIRLTTAKQVLQINTIKKPATRKHVTRKAKPTRTKSKPAKAKPTATNYYSKPQTLAEAWDLVTTMMPFPQSAVALLFAMIILLAMLRACFLPVAVLFLILIPFWALYKLSSK